MSEAEKLKESQDMIITDALLKSLVQIIQLMNYDVLKREEHRMSDNISKYEAIGIIDGLAYFEKLKNMRAIYTRLCAVNNLIQTFYDTNKNIEGEELFGPRTDLN